MTIFSKIAIASAALMSAGSAHAATGTFDTLTYNVAGLLEAFSSAPTPRQEATEQISCYVNDYDIVNVQEDFNYHAALYDACNNHQYRTATTGGMGVGSGLNSMSHYPFDPIQRIRWAACDGVDCLTPKGFTLKQVRLADGVFVDVYNLHTQAGSNDAELTARRANTREALAFVEARSAGNPVIMMGDWNTRFTRGGDAMQEYIAAGFGDVWVELVRGGDYPPHNTSALVCADDWQTSPNCEYVDKVLYRSNNYLDLRPTEYAVRLDAVNAAGERLSDHPPLSTTWNYETNAAASATDAVGGVSGASFNDANYVLGAGASKIKTMNIYAGSRVDAISTTLENGVTLGKHGGSGGTLYSLTLENGEYLRSATVCVGNRSTDRIFYMSVTTSNSRTISGGSTTGECYTWDAPAGMALQGFHGKFGVELDRVGAIFAEL